MKELPSCLLTASSLRVIAAGDALWKGLRPDASKAYVGFEICRALPSIAGPESSGRYFGIHPQVIANSYQSLLHQQTNLGHLLKAYGATRDRIVGTVVGVAFPEKPGRGWQIPESVDQAPIMQVVAVLHKKAEGVDRLIGGHQSAKKPQSVSIEAFSTDLWIYDPEDRSFTRLAEAPEKFGESVWKDPELGWMAGKFEGRQLAFAPGGESGKTDFEGVGYTPTPAEREAKITNIRAEMESGMMIAAMACADWEPGMTVKWTPILAGRDAGKGEVVEVITEGSHLVGGRRLEADVAHPLLRVKVRGRGEFLRSAASLKKADV